MFGIEVLRGIAALTVVFHHSWSLGTTPRFRGYWLVEGFGTWGVSLFFVLSGFLLADHFWGERQPGRLRSFYTRRVFRIAPAYYLNVALLFLFFAEHQLLFSSQGAKQVLANATFTQHLFPETASNLNVNGVLWTLTIEMILYLVMPLLSLATRITRGWAVVAMIGIGLGYRLFVARAGSGLQDFYFAEGFPDHMARLFLARQFVGILPLFAVGIGLKWLVTQHDLRLPTRVVTALPRSILIFMLLVPSLLALVFIERATNYTHWVWFTGFEFLLGLLFVPALLACSSSVTQPVTAVDRPFVWLGVRSYGLYLWHFPIILAVYGRGPLIAPPDVSPAAVKIGIVLLLSLSAAALSWALVERPAQAIGRGWALRGRSWPRTHQRPA